jgi:Bacterial Ig domain
MRHRLFAIGTGALLAVGLAGPVFAAAPVAQSDMRAILEGGSTTLDVLGNDWDPDGDALTIDSFTQPVGGTVTRVAAPGSLHIAPFPNFSGYLLFDYTVSDGHGGQSTAMVLVNVDPVDDAPVAVSTSAVSAFRAAIHVPIEGSDWETCELTFAVVSAPKHGSLSAPIAAPCTSGGPADPGPLEANTDHATVIYTPKPGFDGTDSFTFTVSDGTTVSAPATVELSIVRPKARPKHDRLAADLFALLARRSRPIGH